jgi:hypothetical protein
MTRHLRVFAFLLMGAVLAASGWGAGRRGASPCPFEPSGRQPIRAVMGEWDPLWEDLPIAAELRYDNAAAAQTPYILIQFHGPLTEEQRGELASLGVRLFDFLPENAFLARVEPSERGRLHALSFVRWLGSYHPGYKIGPNVGRAFFTDPDRIAFGKMVLDVHLFRDADMAQTLARMQAMGAEVFGSSVYGDSRKIRLAVNGMADVRALAGLDGIYFMDELGEVTMRNNDATWVAQTNLSANRKVWNQGIRGEGQVVGVIDGALSMASCYFQDTVNNTPGPAHRKVVSYYGSSTPADSHGTHVSGTAAGLNYSGDTSNAGHAYNAKIAFTNLNNVTGWSNAPSNFASLMTTHHNDGARVHTNSWGEDFVTSYTSFCVEIDTFTRNQEDDLVCFASTNQATLYTPENSRNVLAVGASQRQPNQANHCSGGAGPTSDGRRKPEVYLPGCSTVSASTAACSTATMTGTSMASPAVAGNGVLVRQYFLEGWYPLGAKGGTPLTPSGALLKAMLINASVDMTGVAGYPSNQEGWGRILLDNALYFSGDTRTLYVEDVRHAQGLATSEMDSYTFTVNSSAEPLRVTLVWTDQPSALLTASPVVNRLHLEVTDPAAVSYKGNVFSGGQSATGGSFDNLNNVQQVFRTSPSTGSYEVRVYGNQVNSGPQGYALVVTGDVSTISCGMTGASAAPAGPLSLCAGDSALLTCAPVGGTGPFDYQWRLGGSPIGGATASTYAVSAAGSYDCLVTDTGEPGCSRASNAVSVTVNPLPSASFSHDAPKCASDAVNFSGPVAPAQVFYSNACDSLTGWTTSGTPDVVTTPADSCFGGGGNLFRLGTGAESAARGVSTAGYSGISVTFDWQTNTSMDTGEGLFFEWSANGGGAWTTLPLLGDGGNGAWACAQSYALGAAADNNASFMLRFRSNGSSGASEYAYVDNVSIRGIPSGALLYAWDFDDSGNTDSILQNPSYLYPSAGNWTARLTTTDASTGCVNTSTQGVTINAPAPSITASCNGSLRHLDAGAGYVSYAWLPGGATAQEIDVPDDGSLYVVTVTDGGGCQGSDSHSAVLGCAAPPPGEMNGLYFGDGDSLFWTAAAPGYNLYKGNIANLAPNNYGSCLASGLNTATYDDLTVIPPGGAAWFYLVAGTNGTAEGTLGTSSGGTERLPSGPCL